MKQRTDTTESDVMNNAIKDILDVVPFTVKGRITEVRGPSLKAQVPNAAIGDLVKISLVNQRARAEKYIVAEVVGFTNDDTILSPFGPTTGIAPGAVVTVLYEPPSIALGPSLLGSVLDSLGKPYSNPKFSSSAINTNFCDLPYCRGSIDNECPAPLSRAPISQVFPTGIRAIDGLLTMGKGQRLGIFAEPGVGKSTLLGMIARHSAADVNVIGLIGERGREVREFIENTLDEETRKKTVVVVSTSDESAMNRATAAQTATRIAEYFRDNGKEVLLQIDSLTRLFRAYREVGLAAGELPVRHGYPPSAFAKLPRLIERAGTSAIGSITAFYTILLTADLDEDPMVEEVRGLTDGHLVLSRAIAEQNHYPAIDVTASLSRLQNQVLDEQSLKVASNIRADLARIAKDRDLVALGATSSPEFTSALAKEDVINAFLRQNTNEYSSFEETKEKLRSLG